MPRKNKEKRLNSKQEIENKSGLILIGTFITWVFFLLDMLFIAHNNAFIIIAVSIGVWTVGLVLAKPGQFATSVQKNGFWKALFGSGTNEVRRQRRR